MAESKDRCGTVPHENGQILLRDAGHFQKATICCGLVLLGFRVVVFPLHSLPAFVLLVKSQIKSYL